MAITKTVQTLIAAATALAAGTTKTAPGVTGATVNCAGYYGGELTYKITNGATAPTVAGAITFQVSHDGTNWYDYYTIGGDTASASISSGSLFLDRGVMNVRAIAYGNTIQPVTVEAFLQAVTGV